MRRSMVNEPTDQIGVTNLHPLRFGDSSTYEFQCALFFRIRVSLKSRSHLGLYPSDCGSFFYFYPVFFNQLPSINRERS